MGTVGKKIYFFMGTTAEFIKLAPVIKELKTRKIKFKIITSGQNPINFSDLNGYMGSVKADIALKEKPKKSSMLLFLFWAIKSIFEGLFLLRNEFSNLNKNNSYFIVHGDTISSTIGSIIAKFYNLKLVHIESGLRSFSFLEPFPEEICRVINMKLADILFCPNQWAVNNIKNFRGIKIDTKQNTLIETFKWAMTVNKALNFNGIYKKYYILYIRRQEHLYFQKDWTKKIIKTVTDNSPDNLKCLFSIHFLNKDLLSKNTSQKLTPIHKLPYADFMKLMSQAEFIATDGCTNQEEASYMGLPVLALRNRTERIEGLGKNVVISYGNKQIIRDFIKNYKKYRQVPVSFKKHPSKIIVDCLF